MTAAFELAGEQYAALGVDVEKALASLANVAVSLQCWQGDDVGGFENPGGALGGGLAVTGNYPGKARTPDELRQDVEQACRLIPGRHRLNLHAFYLETGGARVDRDAIEPAHFARWIDWAKSRQMGLDFNPTCFSHPKAADGFTLSHADEGIRQFWIDHCIASRRIGAHIGQALGWTCVTNIWIPDGYKDSPVDRRAPRERLRAALDAVLQEEIDPRWNRDAVEPKLFGIGSESFVVGSHEFYLAYAVSRKLMLCLDAGHFHPTETISDKISAVLGYLDEILLHVSRGVRWDSDHVVTLTDDLRAIAEEIVRGDYLGRVHLGLDYFDASINRVAAWVIGARNLLKALLIALLEPTAQLRDLERAGNLTARLALMEDARSLPFGAVWEECCRRAGVPVDGAWMGEVDTYERTVLAKRA
ncbi:MAG: L-rhamnose isomerase [Lentisphaerae bacterium]|nr:L-rhamnose isomerase [Lentisphaerota bacterium]